MFTKQAPLIILDIKSAIFTANNGKDTKHTIQVSRIMNLVRNGEECNFHKKVWCEGGLQLAHIVTKNVRDDELNPILR